MVDKTQYALALLKAMNPSFVFESPKMPVGGDENMQAVAQYLNSRSYRRDMNNAKEGQEQAYNNHTSPYNNGGSITYDNSNGDFTGVNVPTYTDYPTSPSVTVNGQAISNTNNGLTNDGNNIVNPNGALTVGSTGTQWDTAVNNNAVNNANTIATPKITGFSNSSGDGLVDAQNRLLNKYTKIGDTSDGTSLGHMFNKSNLTFNEPATVKDVLSTDGGSVADRRYRDIVDNPITDTEVEQNQPMRALVEDYFAKRNANALKDYPDMTFNDNGIEMNKNLPFKQRVEDYIAQRKAQEGTNYPNIRYNYSFDPITDTEVERNEYYDNNPPARGNTNWDKALNPEGYTGNIDLSNRPQVTNPDGSISTVRSKSFNIDGKEVLLPTISPDGKNLTNQEAIDLYKSTGQNLGVFNTIEEANKAAQDIHNQQARQIAQPQVQTPAQQTLQVQQRTKPENQIAKSIALNSNGTITNPAQQTMSNLKDGTVNNDKGTLRTREEYYNALEQDGVTNPFIRQMLYNQNVAPLEEETKRVQLENAFKTYINPNATPEDKSKAKIDIAIAMGKPTFWEDRDYKIKKDEEAMAFARERFNANEDYRNRVLSLRDANGKGGTVGGNLANAFSAREGEDGKIILADGKVTSDCIGKINDTLRDMGIEWTDSRTTDGTYEWADKKYGIWEKGATNPNVGDIVIGNANGGQGYADGHAAVYLGNGKYTHVSGSHDTTIATTGSPFSSVYGIIRTSHLGAGKGGNTGRVSSNGRISTGGKVSGTTKGGSSMPFNQALIDSGDNYKKSLELPADAEGKKTNSDKRDEARNNFVSNIGLVYEDNTSEAKRKGENSDALNLAVKTYQDINRTNESGLSDEKLSDVVAEAVHKKTGLNQIDVRDYIQRTINQKTDDFNKQAEINALPQGVKPDDDFDIDSAISHWKSKLKDFKQYKGANETDVNNKFFQDLKRIYGDGILTDTVQKIAEGIGVYDTIDERYKYLGGKGYSDDTDAMTAMHNGYVNSVTDY